MNSSSDSGFYLGLFENLLEGCQVIAPDFTYLYANAAVCEQARVKKSDLLGRKMADVFPGIDKTSMFQSLQNCMRNRQAATFINEFTHLDGNRGWFQLSMEPIKEGVLIMSMEITQLVNSEKRVAKLNRLYKVLSNINQTIVRERNIAEVLKAACSITVEYGGFRMAWIGVPGDSLHHLVTAAYSGMEGAADYAENLEMGLKGSALTFDAIEKALIKGRAEVFELSGEDMGRIPQETRAYAIGSRSCALLPLGPENGTKGVMAFFSEDLGFFDPEEMDLLRELSLDLSLAMEISEGEIQRQRTEVELLESEEKYRILFETSPQGILVADNETWQFRYANPAICRMLGYSEEEFTALKVTDIHPAENLQMVGKELESFLMGKKNIAESLPCRCKDGSVIYADISASPVIMQGRACHVGFFTDVTERLNLRRQLYQSQKLEAIGQLAGGVAHDFNNLLSAMMGYADLMKMHMNQGDPLVDNVNHILKCSERAAALTRQLLAFSRQQILEPQVISANQVVENVESMLNRLLGEHIRLTLRLAPQLGSVKVDPGQLEQVIVNLALNGRDAMPGGGHLILETSEVFLDESYRDRHAGTVTGPHIMVAVTDSGVGMDEATRSRIFEPFFTTKKVGKGTGLGLATVYGIVKQSGGSIWLYSEPGKGSCFKIYLPRVDEAPTEIAPAKADGPGKGGGETILVAEDEETNRNIICEMLRISGYSVLPAADGDEALQVSRSHQGPIHLLITDVVMPGMSGKQLAQGLAESRRDMKVLYTSGYTDNTIVHHGVLDEGTPFLEKPFNFKTLNQKVRELLDAP